MLGSLSALDALRTAAAVQQQDKAEALVKTRKAQAQQDKLSELRRKRDDLLHQLQTAASLSEEAGNEIASSGDGASRDSELQSAIAYLAELKEKLNVYKLTGVSIIKSDQEGKILCFTTSCKGTYLESYHLKLQGLSSGHFKVVHHDLPPFVFSSCVPDSLEVKDIPTLVQPVREALSMYVLRREELKVAESKFCGSLHVVDTSGPVDFICLHLDMSPNLQVEITLKYKNLKNYLPSVVNAVPLRKGAGRLKKDLPSEVKDRLKEYFCGNQLCPAVAMAMEILRDHFNLRNSEDGTGD